MGEKITIDTDDLRNLIREELTAAKSAPADTKDEVEDEIEDVEDEVEDEIEDALEDSEKTLSEMTPKEIEAFFATAVKNAMSDLDSKKTTNAKKITPKPSRRTEEDEGDGKKPVKIRHDDGAETDPTPPPKKKRFSMGWDD